MYTKEITDNFYTAYKNGNIAKALQLWEENKAFLNSSYIEDSSQFPQPLLYEMLINFKRSGKNHHEKLEILKAVIADKNFKTNIDVEYQSRFGNKVQRYNIFEIAVKLHLNELVDFLVAERFDDIKISQTVDGESRLVEVTDLVQKEASTLEFLIDYCDRINDYSLIRKLIATKKIKLSAQVVNFNGEKKYCYEILGERFNTDSKKTRLNPKQIENIVKHPESVGGALRYLCQDVNGHSKVVEIEKAFQAEIEKRKPEPYQLLKPQCPIEVKQPHGFFKFSNKRQQKYAEYLEKRKQYDKALTEYQAEKKEYDVKQKRYEDYCKLIKKYVEPEIAQAYQNFENIHQICLALKKAKTNEEKIK